MEFFNSDKVSDKNKELVRRFLQAYKVKPSRKIIFLKHIVFLLRKSEDVREIMDDRDRVNKIFEDFRNQKIRSGHEQFKTISPAYYSTIVNVSLRFVKWLNDGDKPKGFKDVQNVPKKLQIRDLTPEDMVTWEDGEKLMSATNSVQFKAIIATQLDGGFRPSEFVDINYGDVCVKKDFIMVQVREGKTGKRSVVLWRAVPHLLRWLQAHPTKRKEDPLWIQETQTDNEVKRYEYPAMKKRVKKLFRMIKLDKPNDFYNLRHSACVLSKKDNIPEELAAQKFGHSVEHYVTTYGRLSTEHIIERYYKHYGMGEEKNQPNKNIRCRCGFVNEPGVEICSMCGSPTSVAKAIEMENETEKKFNELNGKFEGVLNILKRISDKGINIPDSEAQKDNEVREIIKEEIRNMLKEHLKPKR